MAKGEGELGANYAKHIDELVAVETNWMIRQLELLKQACNVRQEAHAKTQGDEQAILVAAWHAGVLEGYARWIGASVEHQIVKEDHAASVTRTLIKSQVGVRVERAQPAIVVTRGGSGDGEAS